MRITLAYLVVVDISGYTRFVTKRSLTLAHAEQIVSDLINAVLDQARHPLVLNKLEGDAAMLYRELQPGDVAAARDVLGQVRSFFPAFRACSATLREDRRNCNCDACSNIAALRLKAFVHVGEIAIKQLRQFEELAGEPVILLHRLMKNSVPSNEYVLLTRQAAALANLDETSLRTHTETVDGFGSQDLWLADPAELPQLSSRASSTGDAVAAPLRSRRFRNLPRGRLGFLRAIADRFRHLQV